MKRWFCAFACALLMPALALADFSVGITEMDELNSHLVVLYPQFESEEELNEEEQAAADAQVAAMKALMDIRFQPAEAQQAARRAGAQIGQSAVVYQDGRIASMALIWQGTQADDSDGSRVFTLTMDLETGEEVTFDQLFSDPDAAASAMEAIISEEILDSMNSYIEVAELLPMPRDCFAFDEWGLTVYYQGDKYRNFDGTSGSVYFAWHELEAYIGEESPVYELSRPQSADAQAIEQAVGEGSFGAVSDLALGQTLRSVEENQGLEDPDFTTMAKVYPVKGPRGWAVEIPKYAETADEDTPVSAIRASCIGLHGLMTGRTTREEVLALLGEPDQEVAYDEDEAFDALLVPGQSLMYTLAGHVLEVHLDEEGVLACLILHEAMPESLY